jgi:hypothetical protein
MVGFGGGKLRLIACLVDPVHRYLERSDCSRDREFIILQSFQDVILSYPPRMLDCQLSYAGRSLEPTWRHSKCVRLRSKNISINSNLVQDGPTVPGCYERRKIMR